jgi:putative transposase
MRLTGTVLFKAKNDWQTLSRYMMVEAFAQIDKEAIDPTLRLQRKRLIRASEHQSIREVKPA